MPIDTREEWKMKRPTRACLACLLCWTILCAAWPVFADGAPAVTRDYVSFVYQNRVLREKKVSFYKDVYAYNHTEYGLQPFDAAVPERFFVMDGQGRFALAPIVLDAVDAVRVALYGGDIGKTALFYGQYTEKVRSANKRWGYSGIHEGIDFIAGRGQAIYSILDGEVLRAGYGKDGTIAIYNEQYNATILYLHTTDVEVKRGDLIAAGVLIGYEGSRGAGDFYTHVEVRFGRRTSPSPYRNAVLESDLPYDFFIRALGVQATDREPVTAEAVFEAERMRLAAEAEAQAAREAQAAAEAEAARLAEPTPAPTPEVVVLDEAKEDIPSGFGFVDPSVTPLPTLPPAP